MNFEERIKVAQTKVNTLEDAVDKLEKDKVATQNEILEFEILRDLDEWRSTIITITYGEIYDEEKIRKLVFIEKAKLVAFLTKLLETLR